MRKRMLITTLCAAAVFGAFLALPAQPAAAASSTASASCRSIYIVRRGDTLGAIGARYGVSYWQIARASGISNPNLIFPGERLCISGGNGSATPPSAPPASSSNSAAPVGICGWCRPAGYHSFGPVPDFRGDPYSSSRGQCTWWAATRRLDERFLGLGTYAYQWAYNAPRHGFRTGSWPAVGATVIFQPGVQGAWGGGHAAHVVAVYSNGWFLISEMNFYWNGGGWDRVNYRYAHVGSGVTFIY